MKKILAVLLAVMCFAGLVACNTQPEAETLKLGLGVYVNVTSATNAEGDKAGQANVSITAAVVTVDKDGKIVACDIDTADNTVSYTSDGKANKNNSFMTKYEMGDAYQMTNNETGKTSSWTEQADAFEGVVCGKTLDEVKALIVNGYKGTDEVINAGCTIAISEFINAVEKAVNNAVASNATADHTVKVALHTEQSVQDAEGDKTGKNGLETTIFAAALDAEGKIVAATDDCASVEFTFDANGKSTYDVATAVSTKRELGDNYSMTNYETGKTTTWVQQGDAFAASCVGKKAGDVTALMGQDGKGVADVQNAGCTIYVSGLVKAASKVTK